MDFYLTNLKDKARLHFPMNPEKVSLSSGANLQSYDIMGLGEVKVPLGNKLDVVTWEGKLPGASRKEMNYIKSWKSPTELYGLLKEYRESGTKLRLLITETPINLDVYIESFESTWGGLDDCDYKITLVQAIDLKVYTVDEWNASGKTGNHVQALARPEPPKTKTYTVKSGDSLWKIAQKELGNGARYTELFAVNKPPLSTNPNLIYPGQVLTLPA